MIRSILLAAALAFTTAAAPAGPRVKLWRIDCGNFGPKQLVNSCYLIRQAAA